MRLQFVATLTLFGILASTALAELSFLINVDAVKDQGGSDVSTATGSWLLVADTTRDGFGTIQAGPIALGGLIGSNDLIVFRGDFTTFATPGVVSSNPALILSGGWGEGDPLALVWFPSGGTSPAAVGAGDAYGLYHNASAQDTSAPWVTPADLTFNYPIKLLSSDGNGFFGAGTVVPATATANLEVVAGALDTDGDGIPDSWETANGLDPDDPDDAALDGDGDSDTNLEEYLAGTDPNDPNSVLKILSVEDTAGDQSVFALTWSSVVDPEVMYEISTSPDLASWTSVLAGIPAAAATTQRDVNVAVPGQALYFRVRASR